MYPEYLCIIISRRYKLYIVEGFFIAPHIHLKMQGGVVCHQLCILKWCFPLESLSYFLVPNALFWLGLACRHLTVSSTYHLKTNHLLLSKKVLHSFLGQHLRLLKSKKQLCLLFSPLSLFETGLLVENNHSFVVFSECERRLSKLQWNQILLAGFGVVEVMYCNSFCSLIMEQCCTIV